MRKRFEAQLQLGQTPVERVQLPRGSRDELPPVLAGLQWVFCTPEVNEEVFALLEQKVCAGKKDTGRPGMDLWHILVLGVVRLALACDFDRLGYLVRYDALMRALMALPPPALAGAAEGGGEGEGEDPFHRRTLRDNVALVDDELLEQVNQVVAAHGRELFKKKRARKSRRG